MKRLIDLYTCHTNSKKDKIKRVNRVIINNEGYFEGIYTDQENKPDSYIFGKVDNKSIKVYDMPLGYNETFVLQGSTQDYKYTGTYDILIYGYKLVTKENCEMIIADSDIVREVKDAEISFIINETKKAKRKLSANQKEVYDSYIKKMKKNKKAMEDKFAIKKYVK